MDFVKKKNELEKHQANLTASIQQKQQAFQQLQGLIKQEVDLYNKNAAQLEIIEEALKDIEEAIEK
tara:strand:+ start:6757 stop:6954 length:198 start_codon:yes stop_codon:yes gene_type:complete